VSGPWSIPPSKGGTVPPMTSLARTSTLLVICLSACSSLDDASDTLATLTTSNNDVDTSRDGDSTGDGDGDGDGDPTGDGDGDGEPTGDGDGDGEPTGDGDGDGEPGDGDPADGDASSCMLYAQKLADCSILDYRANLYQCVGVFAMSVENKGPECMAAWDAFILCNLTATCEELQDQVCIDPWYEVIGCSS
jgi:hypothetical protein